MMQCVRLLDACWHIHNMPNPVTPKKHGRGLLHKVGIGGMNTIVYISIVRDINIDNHRLITSHNRESIPIRFYAIYNAHFFKFFPDIPLLLAEAQCSVMIGWFSINLPLWDVFRLPHSTARCKAYEIVRPNIMMAIHKDSGTTLQGSVLTLPFVSTANRQSQLPCHRHLALFFRITLHIWSIGRFRVYMWNVTCNDTISKVNHSIGSE